MKLGNVSQTRTNLDVYSKSETNNFREKNKNRSIGKIKKIKEEYDKRYSFKPVINDNYKE